MPHTPEENDKDDSFEVPPGEGQTNGKQKNRRQNESPTEAFEKRAVAVGPNHAWQVMAGRAKRRDEEINCLGAPPCLGHSKHGQQKKRRAYVEDEVTPAAQDPQIP